MDLERCQGSHVSRLHSGNKLVSYQEIQVCSFVAMSARQPADRPSRLPTISASIGPSGLAAAPTDKVHEHELAHVAPWGPAVH